MPHFVLECSSNVAQPAEPRAFFTKLHTLLAESGPFKLEEIKSRLIRHDDFLVGDGQPERGFAHLSLAILEGRDFTLQTSVGQKLMEFLRAEFAPAKSAGGLQIALSLEIREMRRQTYFK